MIRSPEHEAESPSSDGADEALINAMGSAWILERLCGIDAGGLDGDRALDLVTLWEAVGDTFCAEYCAGWDAA
jgi:hypothetical protein